MDDFSDFFWNQPKRFPIHKWHHYFEIYDRHFSKYRETNPVIVEIGVQHGGSLDMWNHYFKGKCTIYGIDIDPRCALLQDKFDNVKIFIGDQNDQSFLNNLKAQIPNIDILIDDGSHCSSHIIKTFKTLYDNISIGGTYLIEDLHASYWPECEGGLCRKNSSIEYAKTLIDELNAKHIREPQTIDTRRHPWELSNKPYYYKPTTAFSNITDSLHFYDSVLVIEKKMSDSPDIKSSSRS
jgi:hypothetical protein